VSAQATGGYANYTESYSYDKLGNLLNITRPRKPTTTVIQLAAATSPMRLIRLKSRLSHLHAK
jgi:hypothetical protein